MFKKKEFSFNSALDVIQTFQALKFGIMIEQLLYLIISEKFKNSANLTTVNIFYCFTALTLLPKFLVFAEPVTYMFE